MQKQRKKSFEVKTAFSEEFMPFHMLISGSACINVIVLLMRIVAYVFLSFVLQISFPSSHCQWSGVLWFIAIAIFFCCNITKPMRRSRTCGSIVLFDLCVYLMIFTKLNYCFIEEVSGFMGALAMPSHTGLRHLH